MTAPILCPFCDETFRSEENAAWHQFWCGKEGGETREIPGYSLVNGKISGGEN